jgi:hypothetical protein
VQQFGDLGLERLGLGCRRGIGGHYSGFLGVSDPANQENPDIATLFRLASFKASHSMRWRRLPPSRTINNR